MSTTGTDPRAADHSTFTRLAERHRRELQVHCYRMLGSFDEAEDLVQETFLRAWRARSGFQGRSTFRAWLYRIATNACLDAIERRGRRVPAAESDDAGAPPDVAWLQPFPDHLLEGVAAADDEPDAVVVARETIELAFLVAIQHVPPRPRAVLILRDVLGWSAAETAALLDATVPAANSALQRARDALRRHLPEERLEWGEGVDATEGERALLARYVEASERADAAAFVDMLRDDARFTMPPQPGVWTGPEAIVGSWQEGGFGSEEFGRLRCILTRANMQAAVANYVLRPGDEAYRPMALDVLRIVEGKVADIVTFPGSVFDAFELPPEL